MLGRAEEDALKKEVTLKLRWMEFYLTHGKNASLTARHFGIARSTFLRWARRFDPRDSSTLEEGFRGPHSVRKPETPRRTIALIGQYRREEPRISKECIARKLSEEHGIRISPATVGRVVRRYGFFFAETPLHERKRQWAATMHIPIGSLFAAMVAIVFLTAFPLRHAFAAESTSYRLYAGHPGDAEGGPKTGTSFRLDGGTMTWKRSPLVSTSYQLVSGVPVAAPSVSSTPAVESSSTVGGGGRRGVTRGLLSGALLPDSSPEKPVSPSVPEEPSHPSSPEVSKPDFRAPLTFGDEVGTFLPLFPPAIPKPAVILKEIVTPLGERPLREMHLFSLVDKEISALERECSVDTLQIAGPQPLVGRRHGAAPWIVQGPVAPRRQTFTRGEQIFLMFGFILIGVLLTLLAQLLRRTGMGDLLSETAADEETSRTFAVRELYPRCVRSKFFRTRSRP